MKSVINGALCLLMSVWSLFAIGEDLGPVNQVNYSFEFKVHDGELKQGSVLLSLNKTGTMTFYSKSNEPEYQLKLTPSIDTSRNEEQHISVAHELTQYLNGEWSVVSEPTMVLRPDVPGSMSLLTETGQNSVLLTGEASLVAI